MTGRFSAGLKLAPLRRYQFEKSRRQGVNGAKARKRRQLLIQTEVKGQAVFTANGQRCVPRAGFLHPAAELPAVLRRFQ